MPARILSLHIYPLKSCAGIDLNESPIDRAGLAHDRRWMLIGDDGAFMTQRQWPAMALVRTAITADALRLFAPGMPDLDVALDGSGLEGGPQDVTVWKDTIAARRESEAAGRWFSDSSERRAACTRSTRPRGGRPSSTGSRAGPSRIPTWPTVFRATTISASPTAFRCWWPTRPRWTTSTRACAPKGATGADGPLPTQYRGGANGALRRTTPR